MEKPTNPQPETNKDIEENKIWALIGYLGILVIFPLFLKKDSPFAYYHAKQGLVLFIFAIILGFLGMVPFIGWFLLLPIGGIIIFILWLMGIINALSGKIKPLPLIGGLAEKFKF